MSNPSNCFESNSSKAADSRFLTILFRLGLAAFLSLLTHSIPVHADAAKDVKDCQNIRANAPRSQDDFCDGLKAFRAKDYGHALQSLNTAGKEGNGQAYGLVGYMYEKGRGVQIDNNQAFSYYKQSAALGSADGMHSVGRCYRYGIGTPINEPEAKIWFAKGEAGGTEEGAQPIPGTQRVEPDQADFDAGAKLYNQKQYAQAVPLFRRSAEAGNSRAQLQLGWHYENGEGIEKNEAEAVKWYAKSAALGNSTSQKNLGQMYESGLGTQENWTLAAQLYQKSAAQGDSNGEFALGRAYEFGIGIAQDRQLAIRWFQRSGAQGNGQAAYFAKWLSEPTNFIGFRNDQESSFVMDRIRFSGDFLGGDPTGQTFHTSGERNAFLIAFKSNSNFHQAQTMWAVNHADYTSCQSQGGGSSCHNPGPPPVAPRS